MTKQEFELKAEEILNILEEKINMTKENGNK